MSSCVREIDQLREDALRAVVDAVRGPRIDHAAERLTRLHAQRRGDVNVPARIDRAVHFERPGREVEPPIRRVDQFVRGFGPPARCGSLPKYPVSLSRFDPDRTGGSERPPTGLPTGCGVSMVWNSLNPGRFVRVLTTGAARAAALRLNPGMFGPSSPLPNTPSGPGSRIVVGTSYAENGRFALTFTFRLSMRR